MSDEVRDAQELMGSFNLDALEKISGELEKHIEKDGLGPEKLDDDFFEGDGKIEEAIGGAVRSVELDKKEQKKK